MKAILTRFHDEIDCIKDNHRREIDRLMSDMRAENEENERITAEEREKYSQEVKLRETMQKKRVNEVSREHDRRVNEEIAASEEILRLEKLKIKAEFVTIREARLKTTVEQLSTQRFNQIKALEIALQPQISQIKTEIQSISAQKQTEIPVNSSISGLEVKEKRDVGLETDMICDQEEEKTKEEVEELGVMLNLQCDELQQRVEMFLAAHEARASGLEQRIASLAAECECCEEALAALAVTAESLN